MIYRAHGSEAMACHASGPVPDTWSMTDHSTVMYCRLSDHSVVSGRVTFLFHSNSISIFKETVFVLFRSVFPWKPLAHPGRVASVAVLLNLMASPDTIIVNFTE